MEKYLMVLVNSIKKNLAYKANNFITMISILISFTALFYFWSSIYAQGNKVGNYTIKEMISYYIFVVAYQLLITGDNTAWSIGEEIKNGQITNSILKPINYLKYKMAQSFGNLSYRLVIFLPVILIIMFALRNFLAHPQNLKTYLLFVFCALISYVLFFLVFFTVGITAFWTGESTSLFWTCWVIINFMQGGLMPLDLLPKWFLFISEFLPFRYLFFVPIGLVTGRTSFSYNMLLIPLLWCVVVYFFAQRLFVKGMRKYEGFGI
jgi:ABC-2 type transport system permease protein